MRCKILVGAGISRSALHAQADESVTLVPGMGSGRGESKRGRPKTKWKDACAKEKRGTYTDSG